MDRPPPTPSKKTKGAAPREENAPSKNNLQANYKAIFSRLATTAEQHARVLDFLRIAQSAARIFQLKAKGYGITKTTVSAVDSDGYLHGGVALYSLREVAPC